MSSPYGIFSIVKFKPIKLNIISPVFIEVRYFRSYLQGKYYFDYLQKYFRSYLQGKYYFDYLQKYFRSYLQGKYYFDYLQKYRGDSGKSISNNYNNNLYLHYKNAAIKRSKK